MINIYPIYSIKMTFVSILILSALTLEVQCQNSTSDRFNSFILAITSANGDKQSIIVSDQQFVDQRPVELELTKARQLQEWIGQVAKQIVDEHELEAANYNCKPNVKFNDVIFDDVILTVGQAKQQIKLESYLKKKKQEKKPFLKLLFSFGASLSAEIGGPPHQNETNYLRSLLTAYGCVDGQLIDVEKSGSNFGISKYINIGESVYTFDIENVMERPLCKLVTQKVILKMSSKHDKHKPRHIQSFSLLNALNVQLSALDVIKFADFIARFIHNYFQFPYNFYKKIDSPSSGKETIGQHTVKYARIAHQLILHMRNWGPKELENFSKNYDENFLKESKQWEACVVSIFTRNLLRRVVKSAFLNEYFEGLATKVTFYKKQNDQIIDASQWLMQLFEAQSEQCVKKEEINVGPENAKGSENPNIFAHYDNAIRIDWNIWNAVKQRVDELIEATNKMHKDKELSTFFQNEKCIFVNAKFELDLLTDEQKKTLKLKELRQLLNTKQSECIENIKQYEIELPHKINQNETYWKFNDFIASTVENFGGKLKRNNEEKEEKFVFGLDGANKLLDKLYEFAIKKIVKKGKNREYACRMDQNNFEAEIKAIMGEICGPKIEDLTNFLFTDKQFVKIPPKSANNKWLKFAKVSQLFNLLYSFATRLEALAHGKNNDGTINKNGKKEKIQAFLAVSKCFIIRPEWANKLSIFDLWMEIKMVVLEKNQKNLKTNQESVTGIEIYKNIKQKDEARQISQDNYKILTLMNEQLFSIYESSQIFQKIDHIIGGYGLYFDSQIPIIENLTNQIEKEYELNYKRNSYSFDNLIKRCQLARLSQNIEDNILEMLKEKNMDTKLKSYFNNWELEVQKRNTDFVKEKCETQVAESKKVELLISVRYDLVVNFEHNLQKDIRGRAAKFLRSAYFDEKIYGKSNETDMLRTLEEFTNEKSDETKRTRASISEIQKALNEDNNGKFNLLKLYEWLKATNDHIGETKAKLDEATKERHDLIDAIYKKIESLENEAEAIENKLKDNKLPPADKAHKLKHFIKETKTKMQKLLRTDEHKLKEINQKLTNAKAMLSEMSPGKAQSSSSSPAGKMGEEIDKLYQIIHETEVIQAELDTMLNSYNIESVQHKVKSSNEQKVEALATAKQIEEKLKKNEEMIKLLKASVKKDIGKAKNEMKIIEEMLEKIKSDYGKKIDASLFG